MDQDDRWPKVDVISFYFSSLLAAGTSHRPGIISTIIVTSHGGFVCLIREQVCSGREVEAGDWDRVALPGPAGRSWRAVAFSLFRGG
jgi:hypothetical protein